VRVKFDLRGLFFKFKGLFLVFEDLKFDALLAFWAAVFKSLVSVKF